MDATATAAPQEPKADPAAGPTGPCHCVMAHISRYGPKDRIVGWRQLQDEAEALMGLPRTAPPGLLMSDQGDGWRFFRPTLPLGREQHCLNFPAHHPLSASTETRSRYAWIKKSDDLYLGYLKPEAIALHEAETAELATLRPPAGVRDAQASRVASPPRT